MFVFGPWLPKGVTGFFITNPLPSLAFTWSPCHKKVLLFHCISRFAIIFEVASHCSLAPHASRRSTLGGFFYLRTMRQINRIIIHCTATPEGRHHTAAEIDRWHKERGWSQIGYHYVILLDGTRETGRPIEKAGAHVRGHNADSIGVVYVGGCDTAMKPKDTRTDAQKAALLCLLRELRGKYPNATIHGHNEFDNGKACPSFDAGKEYANI